MNIQEESWSAIQDLEGYEVSTEGRVRRWVSTNGRAHQTILQGRTLREDVTYAIAGTTYTIDELMRWTFGEEYEYSATHDPSEALRDLTQYERNEIILAEGIDPAFTVAENFRIDSARVRRLWDGEE